MNSQRSTTFELNDSRSRNPGPGTGTLAYRPRSGRCRPGHRRHHLVLGKRREQVVVIARARIDRLLEVAETGVVHERLEVELSDIRGLNR